MDTTEYSYPEFAETETQRELWRWAYEVRLSREPERVGKAMDVADRTVETFIHESKK